MVVVLVVMQRQSPMIQKAARTAENPQVPFVDRFVDIPVVRQKQCPTVRKVAVQRQRSVEVPQVHYLGRTVDVPVAAGLQSMETKQRQVPHIDEIVDVPVAA